MEGWDPEKKITVKEENRAKSYADTNVDTAVDAKVNDQNHEENLGREFQTASLGSQEVENKQSCRVDQSDGYHFRRYGSLDFKRTGSFCTNNDGTRDGNGKQTTKEISEDKRGLHAQSEDEIKKIADDDVYFHANKKKVIPFREEQEEQKCKMASMAETTLQYGQNRDKVNFETKNKEVNQTHSDWSPSVNGKVLEPGDRQKFGNSSQVEWTGRERHGHGATEMMDKKEEEAKLLGREEGYHEKFTFTNKYHIGNNNKKLNIAYFSMNGHFKDTSHEKYYDKGGKRAAKPQTGLEVNGTMNIERNLKGYRHPIQRRRSHIKKKGTKFKWNMTIVTETHTKLVKSTSDVDGAKKAVGGLQNGAKAKELVVSTVSGTTYLFKDQPLLTKRQKEEIRRKQIETKWRLVQDGQRPSYYKKTRTDTSKHEEFGDEESLEDTKCQFDFTEDRRYKVSSLF